MIDIKKYTSLTLAKVLSRKHKSVLRSIRGNKSYWEDILCMGKLKEDTYKDSVGRPQKMFVFSKEEYNKWLEILNK